MTTKTYRAKSGLSHVVANELDTLFIPYPRRALTKYPVILLHGSNAPYQFVLGQHSARLPRYLAESGIPAFSAQMHGQTYANDQSMTDIGAAITYALAQLGLSGTKVHLVGISMGAALALRYAGLHTSQVASVTGIIPLTDINAYYNGLSAGATKTEIATAWGVVSPAALPAGADLATVCAPMNGVVPSRLYYASDDALVNPSWVTALGAIIGATVTNMGAGGHTEASIGNAFAYGSGGAAKEIRDFLLANGA
jgi:pimeloyl-ACP methyl ester carboxylesterase